MKIVLMIKGIHDFGRQPLNNSGLNEYDHHYPEVNVGDYLFYLYPKMLNLNKYKVTKVLERYEKDGFTYHRGEMQQDRTEVNELLRTLRIKEPAQVEEIIKEVNKYTI